MKVALSIVLILIILSSCQKTISDFGSSANGTPDSTAAAGQLIGIKVYYLDNGDTLPSDYYEFAYASNPKKLTEYHHLGNIITRQFDLKNDTANKIWVYDENGLLANWFGFAGNVNNLTYKNTFTRSGGELKNLEYVLNNMYTDCQSLQVVNIRKGVLGNFITGSNNGLKTIHYVDTAGGSDILGNLNCDYTVYFDASGRVQMKVLNGIMLRTDDVCTRFKYFPLKDTVRQYFYDAVTGGLQKYIYTIYSGRIGNTPEELEKHVHTLNFTNSNRDNKKLSNFFKEYTWGKDLQAWFNYGDDAGVSVGGGADYDFFQPEFDYLKFGIADKVSGTVEDFMGTKSEGKYTFDYSFNNIYDDKGNLVRSGPVGLTYSSCFEFIYK